MRFPTMRTAHRSHPTLFHWFGIVTLVLAITASLLAPLLAPSDPLAQDLSTGLATPSRAHLLGTDQLGRDLLSRLMWAGRTSLTIAAITLLVSLGLGLLVGISAGYLGGIADEISMSVVNLCMALPSFLVALALIGTLGAGTHNLIIALAFGTWPAYARLIRSAVLTVRTSDYVLAATCLGFSPPYIMRRYLLPVPLGLVAVQISLDAGQTILAIAALGFLGLGIAPPQPEWGTMLADARPFMQTAPHLILAPGLAIFCTVLGCTALSEVVEQRLNPHQ